MSNSKKDYVPYSVLKFLEWVKRIVAYATANFQNWGVIDPKDMIEALLADFETKLAKASDPDLGDPPPQGYHLRESKFTRRKKGTLHLSPVAKRKNSLFLHPLLKQ